MILRTPRRGLISGLALALLISFMPADGFTATSSNSKVYPGRITAPEESPVRGIQKRLKEIGLYNGPLNGRLDEKTVDAIRAYQKQAGLPVDGLANGPLLYHLDSAAHQAQRLLGQLEKSRLKQSKAAQDALASNPKIQSLLKTPGNKNHETTATNSNPDNSRSCYAFPTPACLISEALAATESIKKTELRNWALSGLVASQAFAGDVSAALKIATRISDPRLIMTALGRISQAQVLAGRMTDAQETAAAIPDHRLQAQAYLAIANGQLLAGNPGLAQTNLKSSLSAAEQIDDAHQNALLISEIAKVEAGAGNSEAAGRLLAKAEKMIRKEKKSANHDRILGQLTAARAEIGQLDEAMEMANRITDEEWRVTAYILVAGYQAEAGNISGALKLADGITSKRFQAIALSRVAIAQGKAGDDAGAKNTLRRVKDLSKGISLSYGNDYALFRISVAQAKIGLFKEATQTAFRIKNSALQVRTLWSVTLEQRIANDPDADITEAKTSTAIKALRNDLDKTWLMSDIALAQMENGFKAKARKTFDRALLSARSLKSDWLRARALGKLAETLVALKRQ